MLLLPRCPLLKFLLSLVAGIYLSDLAGNALPLQFITISCAIVFALYILLLIFHKTRDYSFRWIPGIVSYFFLFLAGYCLHQIGTSPLVKERVQVSSIGVVESIENRHNGWHRLSFRALAVYPEAPTLVNTRWQVMVRGNLTDTITVGNHVTLQGMLDKLPRASNPRAFDYGKHLHRNGFSGQVFIDGSQLSLINGISSKPLARAIADVRQQVLRRLESSGVSQVNMPVINAFILGDRQGLDREITDQFIRSGTIHILAVSGMHVGILYLIFNTLLSFLYNKSHPLKAGAVILIMFFYASLTGFSPSISRAVIMFSVIQAGKIFNREASTYNLLCASAIILLVFNPMYIFNAGFWLSHLAVAGIVAFYPLVNDICATRFIVIRWVWSLVAVTLAAQLATLPYSLHVFGTFPTYFLLANLLVLPVVAPILLLSIVVIIISPLPFVSTAVGGLLDSLLTFMVQMAGYFDSLPGSYLEHLWVSLPLAIALYAIIFGFFHLLTAPGSKPRAILATGILAALIAVNLQYLNKALSETLVVYDSGRHTIIDYFNRGKLTHIYSEGADDSSRKHARDGMLRFLKGSNKEAYFLQLPQLPDSLWASSVEIGGLKYLILSGNGKFDKNFPNVINVEALLLTGDLEVEPDEVFLKVRANTIVASSGCPPWMVSLWRQHAVNNGIEFHSVRHDGAFMVTRKSWP